MHFLCEVVCKACNYNISKRREFPIITDFF